MHHIKYNPKIQRIDFLDSRYYTADGIDFFPSVTTVLEALPKGAGYHQWLKDMGNNADIVMRRAAESGSKVHAACEAYMKGIEVTWCDENGRELYNMDEWLMVLRFCDFWDRVKPTLIGVEFSIISIRMRLGGTIDIICRIDGELWLIDIKTGKDIHDSHALQLGAYAMMWNEINPETPIARFGILHLRAGTKGDDRRGKCIQGAGWKLIEFEEPLTSLWSDFCHLRAVWDRCNPNYKPKNLTVPDRVKLETGGLNDVRRPNQVTEKAA